LQGKPIICTEQLTAGIQTTQLLRDINWEIQAGQHWIITGPMGAGKTILVKCLAGRARIFSGNIRFPFLGKQPGFDLRRKAVKLVSFSDTSKLFHSVNNSHYYQQRYQAFDSEGHLTVRQYLEHGGFDAGNPRHWSVIQHTALEPLLDLERIKLSSGQTRKMLIAKAIISEPQVLILDNPYLGLDEPSRRIFNDYLNTLVYKRGLTIILAGHYDVLPKCITHRLHLDRGRVVAQGTVEEVKNQLAEDIEPAAEDQLLAGLKPYFQRTPRSDLQTIIHLEGVSVNYGPKQIFDDLSWRVRTGEKWALLGNNGSGKSTILSLIYADNPQAYAKSITLFDRKRGSGESIWEIKKRIGFTSSELHAYFEYNLKARDVVLTGLWDGFFIQRKPTAEQLEWTQRMFRFFGMEECLSRPFNALSTGQQRLLFFLRALIKAPELLLLDEPFQGLDQTTIERCRRLLDEVLDEKHAMVFITHYRREIPSSVKQVLKLKG
jgi:molybdate transport system ATP-binding protein